MSAEAGGKVWKPIRSLDELCPEDRERWQRFCDLVNEHAPTVLAKIAARRAAEETLTPAEAKKEAA